MKRNHHNTIDSIETEAARTETEARRVAHQSLTFWTKPWQTRSTGPDRCKFPCGACCCCCRPTWWCILSSCCCCCVATFSSTNDDSISNSLTLLPVCFACCHYSATAHSVVACGTTLLLPLLLLLSLSLSLNLIYIAPQSGAQIIYIYICIQRTVYNCWTLDCVSASFRLPRFWFLSRYTVVVLVDLVRREGQSSSLVDSLAAM